MTTEFKFPDVGEGITEGEIVKWHVKEGDQVKEHQVLAEIETDKAIVEMPSPATGTILKIMHKEGDTVKVGETLVVIGEKGEKVHAPSQTQKITVAQTKASKPEKRVSTGVVGEIPEAIEAQEFVCQKCGAKFSSQDLLNRHLPIHTMAKTVEEVLATPATRRIGRELGVDLSKVTGTGALGRITEQDVRNFAHQVMEKPKEQVESVGPKIIKKEYDMFGYLERVPMKGIRKATAKRMAESASKIPHVTHIDDADVTELVKLREKEKVNAEKKKIHLTFLPFIVKALVASLKKFPYFNSVLDETHEEIIIKKYYNIGIAMETTDGLMVPVIKIADEKSIFDIALEISKLADAAEKRKIDLGELKGGTFTITNYGAIGGIYGTPIINYPEVAILGTGRIYDKPVVVKNKIQIRKVLPLSLAFDHRVVDGADAAQFVNTLKQYLENPETILKKENGKKGK